MKLVTDLYAFWRIMHSSRPDASPSTSDEPSPTTVSIPTTSKQPTGPLASPPDSESIKKAGYGWEKGKKFCLYCDQIYDDSLVASGAGRFPSLVVSI